MQSAVCNFIQKYCKYPSESWGRACHWSGWERTWASCSASTQPTDIRLQKKKKKKQRKREKKQLIARVHLLSFGSDENMPENTDWLELSTDAEDSRTGCILSMWYEYVQLPERKNTKKKEGKERIACVARKYFATDSTSQVSEMKY